MTPRSITLAALGFALALLIVVRAPAQASYDVKAHYAKREVYIPMRDGVKLFTIIYSPRSAAERYPILMTRTAYGIGPYGADAYRTVVGPNNEFAKEGYIFVYQDTRGKFKSEGEFIHHVPYVKGSSKPNESTDTWDTIDWLVKNVANNNGRVGQWGISWDGWEVSQGMIGAHPALKASSPQAPPQDQFLGDDYHSGGAYQVMYGFNWMSTNARARVAPQRRHARADRVRLENRGVLPRERRAAVLQLLPERSAAAEGDAVRGRRTAESSGSCRLRDRRQPMARLPAVAAEERRAA